MAISSNASILSEAVVVVVGVGVVGVDVPLAVVVVGNGNGSGWTLEVSSFFELLSSDVAEMVVVVLGVVVVVVEMVLLIVGSVDVIVIRIGSITNFSLSGKDKVSSSSSTISTSPPKSTKGRMMISVPVLPFSGGPRGSLLSSSGLDSISATITTSSNTTSLEGSSILLCPSAAIPCLTVSTTDLSSSTTNFPSLSSSVSSSGSSSVSSFGEGLYGVRLTKLVKGFNFWGVW